MRRAERPTASPMEMMRPTAFASRRACTGVRDRPAACSSRSERSAAITRFGGTVNVNALVSTIMPSTYSRCVGTSTLFWMLMISPSPRKRSTSVEENSIASPWESNMKTQPSM